ncbi:hypothetical protein L208DRAFT_1415199, partial [Tricholoma matsutake]
HHGQWSATIAPSSSEKYLLGHAAALAGRKFIVSHSDSYFGQIFLYPPTLKDIKLQRQLQQQNPKRDSEFYVGKNILATESCSRSTTHVAGTAACCLGDGLVLQTGVRCPSQGPNTAPIC